MADKIARHYDASKNPDNGYLPGVPLRDLTEADWAELNERQQRAVDACGWYGGGKAAPITPTKPEKQPAPAPLKADEAKV